MPSSEFVFVTVEEVELSLSSVVALPAEKGVGSDEEDDGRVLEARVRASEQVANVHELALLQRSSWTRALSRKLMAESSSGVCRRDEEEVLREESDGRRRAELEATLRETWALSEVDDDSEKDLEEAIGSFRDAEEAVTFLKERGRCVALSLSKRRPRQKDLSANDVSEAQARKDIERDNLVVRVDESGTPKAATSFLKKKRSQASLLDASSSSNNASSKSLFLGDERRRPGAQLHATCEAKAYDVVLASIADAQRTLVRRADAGDWRPIDDVDLKALAKASLRAVNRTESGGLALETLADLLPSCLTPVPDSRNAEPLRIDLSLGPAEDPSATSTYNWRWGLRANVEGSTLYRLFASDSDFSRPIALARATYCNFLILPLDALDQKKDQPGPVVLYDRHRASVNIHISLADDDH